MIQKRQVLGSNVIERAFNLQVRLHLHEKIARKFALPFHLARNPYYFSVFSSASNNNISGHIFPGYNLSRTTLLEKGRTIVERMLVRIK